MTMKSFEELFPTLPMSRQQLRDTSETRIAEARKFIEYSRKLIDQSLIILNKDQRKKKS
jgi:hypothetical protein